MSVDAALVEPWWAEYGLDDAPPWAEPPTEIPAWLLALPVSDEEPTCVCGRPLPDVEPEPVRWAVPGVWDESVEPAPVGALVAQLQDVVDRLGRVEAFTLPGGQALAEAEALLAVVRQLRVQQMARTADVTDRQLFAAAGHRSTAAWLRHAGPDAVAADRVLAGKLVRLVHLREAVQAGRVSLVAAGKVATAMGRVERVLDRPDGLVDGQPGEPLVSAVVGNVVDLVCRDRFGLSTADPAQATVLADLDRRTGAILAGGGSQAERVEQAFTLVAELISPRALPAALEELLGALRPERLEEQDRAAREKRAASLARCSDGTWRLEATLTPECGERLFTALAAEARRDPANPVDTARREAHRAETADAEGRDRFSHPDPVAPWESEALTAFGGAEELVPRSRSKRLHDALDRLVTRYLAAGLGGTHDKVPVQMTVTFSAGLAESRPGALPGRGPSGRPLARSLLRRLWCDSAVTAVLLDRGWVPLAIAHHGRTLTGPERRAAAVQFDSRCAGDGCCPGQPDPLVALVPHHVQRYSKHGRTSLEETLLVCPALHQDLHLGKRTVRLRDGRLVSEDGWITDESLRR